MPAELLALVEFLQAHAGDGVLDAAAMARLQDELVPAALAAWPGLRQVLEARVSHVSDTRDDAVCNWTAAGAFAAPLTREQVFALTQQLMLQVCLPVFAPAIGWKPGTPCGALIFHACVGFHLFSVSHSLPLLFFSPRFPCTLPSFSLYILPKLRFLASFDQV